MSQIELSDIIARSLLGAPELLIEHDEKGMFLQWDSFEVELSTGLVRFMNARTHIATVKLGYPVSGADYVRFTELEGRLRIKAS